VIEAIKKKDFNEAHTKAEEQAKFLRDYIRRCMGAEHVCCDSEDYEQAQKISKAIKYAVHIKKVTSETGGLAFGAVRRIQELLTQYKRHCENTRLEMKEAGEERNYTKAIAMQHDLESSKNDYSLKLCAHVDRILESGNLRALEVGCRSIQEAHPELQPDIMNAAAEPDKAGQEEDQNGKNRESSFEGPVMIAAPPGTARRPHSARSAREEEPEKHRFSGNTKLKPDKMKEMGKRLCVPKKTAAEKATTDEDLQKGLFMLKEEYDNCTFRPTIGVKGVLTSSIAKPHKEMTFWPTDRYPRRAPSPHGKARFEGDTNMDPSGEIQLKNCMTYISEGKYWEVEADLKDKYDRGDYGHALEAALKLIKEGLDNENQIRKWDLTAKEATALRKLKGKPLLFQLVDDLRAKKFLERAETETNKSKAYFDKVKADIKLQEDEKDARMSRIHKIRPTSYQSLTEGTDTPGRQKRRKALEEMLAHKGPRADIAECKQLVKSHCGFPDMGEIADHLSSLCENNEQLKQILRCDDKEARKVKVAEGDLMIRVAANLCKRAKFVSRMDSYNYKTKS